MKLVLETQSAYVFTHDTDERTFLVAKEDLEKRINSEFESDIIGYFVTQDRILRVHRKSVYGEQIISCLRREGKIS